MDKDEVYVDLEQSEFIRGLLVWRFANEWIFSTLS